MTLQDSVCMYIEAEDVLAVARMVGWDEWSWTTVTLWRTWNESECEVWLTCWQEESGNENHKKAWYWPTVTLSRLHKDAYCSSQRNQGKSEEKKRSTKSCLINTKAGKEHGDVKGRKDKHKHIVSSKKSSIAVCISGNSYFKTDHLLRDSGITQGCKE